MRTIKIAIAQLQGYWPASMSSADKLAANVAEFGARLRQAAKCEPDLILVGECFNHNDVPAGDRSYDEDVIDGALCRTAASTARDASCHIAYGVNGTHESIRRNAVVLVDREGDVTGVYDKVHLTANEARNGAVPGDAFPVFDTDLGKVGIMTCHDMSYPESARCLMLNGAELILWPTMWSGWGDELTNTVIRSRCIDNSVFLVMASTGQNPDAVNWVGGVKSLSAIYNPEGKIVCQKADRLPGVLVGEIDLDFKRIAPFFTTGADDRFLECVLQERRPDAYGAIIRAPRPSQSEEAPVIDASHGRHIKITDGLHLVGRGIWGGLAPISGDCDANAYLFVSDGQAALFDAGCEEPPTRLMANILSTGVAAENVRTLALTHLHWDHSVAVPALTDLWPQLEVLASATGAEVLLDQGNECLVGTAMLETAAQRLYRRPAIGRRLQDGDAFRVGDVEFRAIALPGHTPDATGYVADYGGTRLLIGGDVLIGDQGAVKGAVGWLDGLWRSNIEAYMRSLDRIEQLDPDLVVGGHGEPMVGKDQVQQSLRHARERLQYLVDMPDLGTTLPIFGGRDPSYD